MTERSIHQAFLDAQKKIEPVKKDGRNPYFNSRYSTLEAVISTVKLPLNDEGFTIQQPIMGDKVKTRLQYIDGNTIEDEGTPIVCKINNDPQAQGSAITYARRYGLMSLLGLSATDDDGESATSHSPVKEVKAEPPVARRVAPVQPEAKPATPIQPTQVTGIPITDGQRKAIFAITKSKGISEDDLKVMFGFESMTELTKQRASEIITGLNKR